MGSDGAPGAWALDWRLTIPSCFTALRIASLHATGSVYATSQNHGRNIRLESRLPFVVYLDGVRHQARQRLKYINKSQAAEVQPAPKRRRK